MKLENENYQFSEYFLNSPWKYQMWKCQISKIEPEVISETTVFLTICLFQLIGFNPIFHLIFFHPSSHLTTLIWLFSLFFHTAQDPHPTVTMFPKSSKVGIGMMGMESNWDYVEGMISPLTGCWRKISWRKKQKKVNMKNNLRFAKCRNDEKYNHTF